MIPLEVEAGRIRGRKVWRVVETIGATELLLYGLANTIVAWAVLTGVIATPDGYNRPAELGHAALWDPLFFLWGAFLLAGLRATRGRLPTPTPHRTGQ